MSTDPKRDLIIDRKPPFSFPKNFSQFDTALSKITPPKAPAVLIRPRLLRQIEKAGEKRLILILGQAAQGKSTLAACHIETSLLPAAWLNLDQSDSDPANLFHWLVSAFQHSLPDLPFLSLRALPSIAQGPRVEIPLFREWIEALFGPVREPLQLVLDGLDRLDLNAPSFLFLQTLAAEAPSHVRLFMLSREEPPLGFQDHKIKQTALILTNEDLAFTPAETRVFFQQTRGLSLPSTQIEKIHSYTEGWVGGLLLFSELLKRQSEEVRGEFISERVHDRFRNEVFQFFSEAVLSVQPRESRDFFIKSSILERIENDFLGHFTEAKNMEEVLHEAARKNLFVQSFYEEGKGWVFRYHHLFRDILKLKFEAELRPEDRKALYLEAGRIYQRKGRWEEAVPFFLMAQDFEAANLAIEKAGLTLILSGRTADLKQWLKGLPEEMVQENPWLLYYFSMAGRFTAISENHHSLYRAFTLFEEKEDIRGCLLSLAAFIEASLFRSHDLVPLSRLLAKAEALLNSLGQEHFTREKAILWFQVGFGFTIRGGNPRKGFWACQNAYLLARALGDTTLQIEALIHAYEALIWQGELLLAEEKATEIEALIEKHPYPEMVTFYQVTRFVLYLLKGDLKKAEELVQLGQKECERLGFLPLFQLTLIHEMMLRPSLGQFQEAEETGNRILQFSTAMGSSFMTGLAMLYMGRNFYFQGSFEKARTFFQESHSLLSKDEVHSPLHLHLLGICRGLLGEALYPEGTVLKELQDALDYFCEMSGFLAREAHFALALLYWGRGERGKTAGHLHSGFKITREKGLTQSVFISPKDLTRVCVLTIELGSREDSDLAAHLLSTHQASLVAPELERLSPHLDSIVRARVSAMKDSLHRAGLPILKIETLGGLKVSRAGSPINQEEWRGGQAKNLLKAIITLDRGGVPKEALIETLWPEGRPDRSEKTFKVALHRLRKVLEPDMNSGYGHSYVLLKGNRVSLDKGLCEVDLDRFSALILEGEKKEKLQQIKEALSAYKEATGLYKGDFLMDDPLNDWAAHKREELRRKYFGLLLTVARIYEHRGSFTKAISSYEKAVAFDPIMEDPYRRLMTLYINVARPNEAIKTFRACEKALREGLDTPPDPLTLSIYRKIVSS
jgi:LuxR family transcriptional regulator, maltose regulon positive regulatory protein